MPWQLAIHLLNFIDPSSNLDGGKKIHSLQIIKLITIKITLKYLFVLLIPGR